MNCPRDIEVMEFQGYWKHPRYQCEKCGGMLVSEREVMEALGFRPGNTFALTVGAELAKLPQSHLLCPREGNAMREIVHNEVQLDICPACCSLWLDREGYQKIAATRKEKTSPKDDRGGFEGDSGMHGDLGLDRLRGFLDDAFEAMSDLPSVD